MDYESVSESGRKILFHEVPSKNIKTRTFQMFEKIMENDDKELIDLVAIGKTKTFLEKCRQAGYKRISIGIKDKRIKECRGWPFNCDGSVFASPARYQNDDGHISSSQNNGFPAIWKILEKLGASTGCGNSQQHNIKTGSLINGVYILRGRGWIRKLKKEGRKGYKEVENIADVYTTDENWTVKPK
jgi:hypothetical protein